MKKSILVFGIQRGASSMLGSIFSQAANSMGMQYVDTSKNLYENGLSTDSLSSEYFNPYGNIYGVFREPFAALNQLNLNKYTVILMLRDPRDCLVSHYFAHKNIHDKFIPAEEDLYSFKFDHCYSDISTHVLMYAFYYKSIFNAYAEFVVRNPSVNFFTYESYYTNKRLWATYLADVVLNLGDNAKSFVDICNTNAPLHVVEDEFNHIRSALPYDCFNKLSPIVIDYLTDYFRGTLDFLNQYNKSDLHTRIYSSNADRLNFESINYSIAALKTENGYRIKEIDDLSNLVKNSFS